MFRWHAGRVVVLLLGCSVARAQPTYKLEVKPQLKPLATLTLEGASIRRTSLADDPGFRIQYVFKKDDKPLLVLEGRTRMVVEIPEKKPGIYSVVLELFYPGYKGGNEQKGKFKPVSNELIYEIEPRAPAGVLVKLLGSKSLRPDNSQVLGQPALILQCGKENGAREKELLGPGYAYELLQGSGYDGWKPPAGKSHCWQEREKVHFILKVPVGVTGILRMQMVDGDGTNALFRTQILNVEGKQVANQQVFHGPGVIELVQIDSKDTQDGKIEVVIQNTRKDLTAVISSIEFFPREKRP